MRVTARRPAVAGFGLLYDVIVVSFAAFVLVAVPLVYFQRIAGDFFRQMQQEQNAFFAQIQNSFVQRQPVAVVCECLVRESLSFFGL